MCVVWNYVAFFWTLKYGSNGWTWQQPFRFGVDRDARGGRGSSFSTKPRILAAWGWVLLWDLSYDGSGLSLGV